MEMPDGNFYNIKIEDCPENVYFDSFGNAHYTGTWVTNKCTKWKLGYVREDIVEALRRENDELNEMKHHLVEGQNNLYSVIENLEREKYHHSRVVEVLQKENDENCRLLGMSAEREIQLLQKVQQLENQVSCLMQNSESQTQTQMALIKKLAKTEWQPIETALRDGTEILITDGSYVEIGLFECRNFVVRNNGDYLDGGYGRNYRTGVKFEYLEYAVPTHWMPRPEPPTTEETKCPT